MIKKIVISFLLLTNILLHKGEWFYERCDYEIAALSVPPIIWYEQTIDGKNQSTFTTRFLHNKAGIYMSQFAKCYFEAVDPFLLFKVIGPVGLLLFLYAIYRAIEIRHLIILSLIILIPILPFLKFLTDYQILIYKLISILGIYYLLFKTNVDKK